MKKGLMYILLLGLLNVEVIAQTSRDSIFLSAMKDEMQRSMDSLQEEGKQKPFYMAHMLSESDQIRVSSTLGAPIEAERTPVMKSTLRLMIGDYEMNDENFVDVYRTYNPTMIRSGVSLPLKPDYWGIRRHFWASANNIYKSAQDSYDKKKELLKLEDKPYPLADFTKDVSKTKLFQPHYTQSPELNDIIEYTNDISAHMLKFPQSILSGVTYNHRNDYSYFVNSEGTEIGLAAQFSSIQVNLEGPTFKHTDDVMLTYITHEDEWFLDKDLIFEDIATVTGDSNYAKKDSLPSLQEDYEGPVLYEGQAVASFFIAYLLNSETDLSASRPFLSNKDEESFKRFQKKIEKEKEEFGKKKIAAKGLTVTDKSSLKAWQGEKLIGSFEIDGEGVKPSDSLVLIQGGVMVNQLSNRIPTPLTSSSSGHYRRMYYQDNTIVRTLSPGVLHVQFDNVMSHEKLVNKFNEMIEEDNLDYGVRIKSLELNSNVEPIQYYQHFTNSDPDKRFRLAYPIYEQINGLKKIIAASEEWVVYNFFWSPGGGQYAAMGYYGETLTGIPISIIAPAAILVRDFDVRKSEDEEYMYYPMMNSKEPPIKGPLQD